MEMSDKKSFPNLKYLTFYKTYFFNIFLNVIFKTKQNDIHVHYTARYFTSEFKKILYPNSRVEKQRGNIRQLTYNSDLFGKISELMRSNLLQSPLLYNSLPPHSY